MHPLDLKIFILLCSKIFIPTYCFVFPITIQFNSTSKLTSNNKENDKSHKMQQSYLKLPIPHPHQNTTLIRSLILAILASWHHLVVKPTPQTWNYQKLTHLLVLLKQ